MPTGFKVNSTGSGVMAHSYINNVNPEHQDALHNVLADALAKFVPLFSKTLADLRGHLHRTSLLGDEQSTIDTSGMPTDLKAGEARYTACYEEAEAEALNIAAQAHLAAVGRTDKFLWEYDAWCPKESTQWMNDNIATLYTDPVPKPYVEPERQLGTGYSLNGKTMQVITKIAEM